MGQNAAKGASQKNDDHVRLDIHTIPTMGWSMDPEGLVDFVNQPWIDYSGMALEDLRKDPNGPIHPDDRERIVENWQRTKAIGVTSELEVRLRRSDGIYRWFLVRTAPFKDETGKIVKWFGVSVDVDDRKQMEEALRDAEMNFRALSLKLRSVKEEEGIRIARDIHDELGSILTSLGWDLERFENAISKLSDEPQKAELRNRVEGMLKLTDMTVNIIRRISSQLRSPVTGDLGLIEAIEMQIEQFRERTGLELHFEKRIDKVDLEVEVSTAVFRILQEALTNILRHSGATTFGVDLSRDNGTFVMTISDNGKGITKDETSSPKSLGIIGMRERARLIGGDIVIARGEAQGTVVTVKVPI